MEGLQVTRLKLRDQVQCEKRCTCIMGGLQVTRIKLRDQVQCEKRYIYASWETCFLKKHFAVNVEELL